MQTSCFILKQLVYLVRATGLEPARIFPLEPKSSAFANSATPAYVGFIEF